MSHSGYGGQALVRKWEPQMGMGFEPVAVCAAGLRRPGPRGAARLAGGAGDDLVGFGVGAV